MFCTFWKRPISLAVIPFNSELQSSKFPVAKHHECTYALFSTLSDEYERCQKTRMYTQVVMNDVRNHNVSEWWCILSDCVQWVMVIVIYGNSEWWCTVGNGVQWVMMYSEWWCTASDGVQWAMVYTELWCTVSDGGQWAMVYNEWWCTVSDGVQWVMAYSGW